jgi:hypothetical protein
MSVGSSSSTSWASFVDVNLDKVGRLAEESRQYLFAARGCTLNILSLGRGSRGASLASWAGASYQDEHLAPSHFCMPMYSCDSASCFRHWAAALDATDRIIFDSELGKLYYDSDGTGSAAQILSATIDPGLAVGANDFLII